MLSEPQRQNTSMDSNKLQKKNWKIYTIQKLVKLLLDLESLWIHAIMNKMLCNFFQFFPPQKQVVGRPARNLRVTVPPSSFHPPVFTLQLQDT